MNKGAPMLKKYTISNCFPFRPQNAMEAQMNPTKKNGFNNPASLKTKSKKYLSVGRQGEPRPALPARWATVGQPRWAFQTRTGTAQSALTARASQGPGLFKSFRAGGQSAKKAAQHNSWKSAVYLLRKPKPIQRPVQAQSAMRSCCTARHPATIAAAQKKTESGSTVMRMAPRAASGVAVLTSTSIHPARALTSRAKNRSNIRLRPALSIGEKNRTPNWVSPQSEVPRNWV